MLQRHNIQNSILKLPIFSFKISKSILDFKMQKKKKKNPIHFTVSFGISFIYMHSCEKKKSLLLTVAMQMYF